MKETKVNIKEFLKKFNEEYDFLYEHNNNVCGYDDYCLYSQIYY